MTTAQALSEARKAQKDASSRDAAAAISSALSNFDLVTAGDCNAEAAGDNLCLEVQESRFSKEQTDIALGWFSFLVRSL